MSTPRTLSEEDVRAAEANPQLQRLVAAMNRRVPSEEDRKLLLALGRAVRQLREERGMTPAELACASGIRRAELEAIEAGRPYPGRRRARRRRW
ncbi:MAG TPA: helix-turn-helix domain-containing protein [Solirubrobacteraceae bacterium]|jgi:DNA-binding XRE family transcriptional regulator|nr:helix-turn-helix domain-containing protein [Solirubrobacteraceae bacterium]